MALTIARKPPADATKEDPREVDHWREWIYRMLTALNPVTLAATAGAFLRSTGTAPVWSTLILPNAATVNRIVFATASNTWGESVNLTFDGTTLVVTGLSVTGSVKLGTHTPIGAEVLSGYITITDAGGTARKIGVIS